MRMCSDQHNSKADAFQTLANQLQQRMGSGTRHQMDDRSDVRDTIVKATSLVAGVSLQEFYPILLACVSGKRNNLVRDSPLPVHLKQSGNHGVKGTVALVD